jgi:hypothetical protein
MKIDHKVEFKHLYKQSKKEISIVDVPSLNFLTIQGHGSPNDNEDYSQAVGALYAVAYKLKFSVKKGPTGVDYKVMPLEGLWWAEDMNLFNLENRSNWLWQMMIMQPDLITREMFTQALEEVRAKKDPPRLDEVKYESMQEGLSAQIFHAGPYGEAERPSIDKLHAFIEEKGYQLAGKHHEIYLNSPLRSAPEKLKTIIRQPIRKA